MNYSSFRTNRYLRCGTAELSPPPKPYDTEAGPSLKGALDVIRIANEAVDEAINRLLNKAADKVLKGDDKSLSIKTLDFLYTILLL
jgi:hypothetical protein